LGPDLLKKEETVKTADVLQGKFVALYFSAHWCGPCRGFTPQLAEQYKKIVTEMGKNWEVVFVSSDQDENAFKEYFEEMPWLALPYSKRDLKGELSTKYGVRGIPTLVLLNEQGELITTGGRGKVMDAAAFPWLPIPFEQCFANVEDFDINQGVKAIYFSGHWCGPCRNFTPLLKQAYEAVKAEDKDFEVVFVSSDRDQAGFDEYFKEMPWKAIPFKDAAERGSIEEKYGVEGIPALVVLQDGKMCNPSAVGAIRNAGGDDFDASKCAAEFPWKQKAVQELSMGTADNLNECPCLILFQDKEIAEDVQKTNASFMQTAAEAELENALSGKQRKMAYYTHNGPHERITEMMQKMMTELAKENKMVILHFGGQGAYYVADLPTSEDDVTKFVADFHAGKLERKQANPPR
jgi:nucleoredoxin